MATTNLEENLEEKLNLVYTSYIQSIADLMQILKFSKFSRWRFLLVIPLAKLTFCSSLLLLYILTEKLS